MIDDDLDPYDQLERLEQQCIKLTIEQDLLTDKLAEACRLLEGLALQIKHLSKAVVGIQQINRLTHQRLEHLEIKDD
jgi:hypothetical protein